MVDAIARLSQLAVELAEQHRRRRLADAEPACRVAERSQSMDEVQQPQVPQAQAVGSMDRRGYGLRRCRAFRWGASFGRDAAVHR